MGFRPGLVGPFPSVEDGFELCGWLFVEVGVRAAGVVPVADGTSRAVVAGAGSRGHRTGGRAIDEPSVLCSGHSSPCSWGPKIL
jgi:hypothetical protein